MENEIEKDIDDNFHVEDSPQLSMFSDNSPERQKAIALSMWMIGFLIALQAKFCFPDKAIDYMVRFLKAFFSIISQCSPVLKHFSEHFPSSLHTLRNQNTVSHQFEKFVVCTHCFQMYVYENCVRSEGTKSLSKRCSHIKFPNHPHQRRRKPCGNLLLKTVECMSGRRLLYPFKVYCNENLLASLQTMLLQPEFCLNCQQWCKRSSSSDHLEDVYCGRMWQEFQCASFFNSYLSLGFILNIDWFQPYTHTRSSVGVVYLSVLNLPRFLRYKRENVILIGIIPGPREPEDLNPFLKPLVDELLELWEVLGYQLQCLLKEQNR